jgi:hypothetical protein
MIQAVPDYILATADAKELRHRDPNPGRCDPDSIDKILTAATGPCASYLLRAVRRFIDLSAAEKLGCLVDASPVFVSAIPLYSKEQQAIVCELVLCLPFAVAECITAYCSTSVLDGYKHRSLVKRIEVRQATINADCVLELDNDIDGDPASELDSDSKSSDAADGPFNVPRSLRVNIPRHNVPRRNRVNILRRGMNVSGMIGQTELHQ